MNQNQASTSSPASRSTSRKADDGWKEIIETVESVIIAFVLAFVFRAYVVEAFVIPTGSMAPTLLGRHLDVTCDQCGYDFTCDHPGSDDVQKAITSKVYVTCPMCHNLMQLPAGTPIRAGDRILVYKFLYSVDSPRRWDVVVFKTPSVPKTNYIKRLAGLPNEELFIVEGNVYVRPLDEDESAWHIARKSDREAVQRAVWQPMYDSRYIPADGGKVTATRPATNVWSRPWEPFDDARWSFDDRRFYRYTGAAGDRGISEGKLTFDYEGRWLQPFVGLFAYNQLKRENMPPDEPVEDVRLAASIMAEQPTLSVTLSTSARWRDERARWADGRRPVTLAAHVDQTGAVTMTAAYRGESIVLATAADVLPDGAFPTDRTVRLELWCVDQSLSLWVDGNRVLEATFEMPLDDLLHRQPSPAEFPDTAISLSGSPARLYDVAVDRDIIYATTRSAAHTLGVFQKNLPPQFQGQPVTIGPDRFYVLGDNSPLSHDGRYWTQVDPWVREKMFKEGERAMGLVPEELMMGRAFFVYFPAPLPVKKGGAGVIPHFGRMRPIH